MNGRGLTPVRGTLLRVRRSSKLTVAALAATGAAVGVLALDLGEPAPGPVTRGLALVAAPLALAVAIRTVAAFWRGPELVHFPVEQAVLCSGVEATSVRAAALVRGPLGGAGYARRARLVLPFVAWLAAAVVLAGVAAGATDGPEWRRGLELLAIAVVARAVFPARPFWYREHREGAVVLYPASVTAHVRVARGLSKA